MEKADTLKYLQLNLPGLLCKKKNIEFALGTSGEIEDYAKRLRPLLRSTISKTGKKKLII